MPRGEGGGPKTAAGKARSSRNAIKHAILAPDPVVIDGVETAEGWEEFKAVIAESWSPEGAYERELARDIAYGLWRLRRCGIYEAAGINEQVQNAVAALFEPGGGDDDDDEEEPEEEQDDKTEEEPVEVEPERILAQRHLNIIPDTWSFPDLLIRYESHVRKALFQAIHELEAHQARRLGERTPLARVEFNAGPSFAKPRRATAADVPGLQEITARVRLAEIGLAERKLAARNRGGLDGGNLP